MGNLKYAVHAYAWTGSWSNETLDLIDRPFGGVSMRARRYIGYAAIGTTTTALAVLLASFSA